MTECKHFSKISSEDDHNMHVHYAKYFDIDESKLTAQEILEYLQSDSGQGHKDARDKLIEAYFQDKQIIETYSASSDGSASQSSKSDYFEEIEDDMIGDLECNGHDSEEYFDAISNRDDDDDSFDYSTVNITHFEESKRGQQTKTSHQTTKNMRSKDSKVGSEITNASDLIRNLKLQQKSNDSEQKIKDILSMSKANKLFGPDSKQVGIFKYQNDLNTVKNQPKESKVNLIQLLNLSLPSILFVDNQYQESQRSQWIVWLNKVYQVNGSKPMKEIYIQIEVNRLRYTVSSNMQYLRSNLEFETLLSEYLLLSPDVKLHKNNMREALLDLMSVELEGNINEKKQFIYAIILLTQPIRVSLYHKIQKNLRILDISTGLDSISQNCTISNLARNKIILRFQRLLNLNDKIISKQEEAKILKRKKTFIETFNSVHKLFLFIYFNILENEMFWK